MQAARHYYEPASRSPHQRRLSLAVALFGLMLPLVAQSQEYPQKDRPAPEWQVQVTPYAWASGIGGTLVPFSGGTEVKFDESFSDVLEDLDAAFFLAASARRDRLVFAGDLTYAAVSKSGVIAAGVPATGKLRQTSVTLLGGYSVVQTPDMVVDVMGGARAWFVRASVEVPAAAVQVSPSKSLVDPILAARGTFEVAPRWSMTLYGDLGGFGVGSESTWQVVAAASYSLREDVFLSVGWRHLHIDYRDNGTKIEADQTGPILGLTWRF